MANEYIGFSGGSAQGGSLDEMRARIAEKEAQEAAKQEEWRRRNAEVVKRQQEAKAADEAAKERRLREAQAAAFDREFRDRARMAWVGNGGTEAEFEKAWPGIRADLLAEKTKLAMVQASQNQAGLYSNF